MRISWRSLSAVAACLLGPACTLAADSVTIQVYTNVLPVCRFAASSNIDPMGKPLDGGAASPAGAITYRCSNGLAPAFTITASCVGCPDSAPLMLSDGGVGRGMGSGRELTLVVTAASVQGPVQTAAFGLGDVNVTVSP
jgi:hypothetical protein